MLPSDQFLSFGCAFYVVELVEDYGWQSGGHGEDKRSRLVLRYWPSVVSNWDIAVGIVTRMRARPSGVRLWLAKRKAWGGKRPRPILRCNPTVFLLGKPEGRRSLGTPRRRWVDNIRMDLQEVGCGYMDRIGLAQDRDRWRTLVSAVMNLQGFCEMRGISWLAANQLASQEGLYTME